MRKVIIFVFLFAIVFFVSPVLFGGTRYCFPWAVDNGPGSAWCFYSSSGADPYYTGGVKLSR